MPDETASPHRLLQPPAWPRPRGYANGVAARGAQVYVGGQIGWNERQELAEGFLAQARQAMKNVVAVLAEAGAEPRHLVRLTWYVIDVAEYDQAQHELGRAYREHFGRHYPAMTLVQVVRLAEREARVEIEATAVVP